MRAFTVTVHTTATHTESAVWSASSVVGSHAGRVPADLAMTSLMSDGRTAAASCYGRKRPGAASRAARMRGSSASMSTILVRLEAPETRRTALRRTPNDPATAASAASVALPSTARALTRTTRAPSCSPPTPGRAEPGFTRIAIRMQPVSTSNCGQADCGVIRMVSASRRPGDSRTADMASAVRRLRGSACRIRMAILSVSGPGATWSSAHGCPAASLADGPLITDRLWPRWRRRSPGPGRPVPGMHGPRAGGRRPRRTSRPARGSSGRGASR